MKSPRLTASLSWALAPCDDVTPGGVTGASSAKPQASVRLMASAAVATNILAIPLPPHCMIAFFWCSNVLAMPPTRVV